MDSDGPLGACSLEMEHHGDCDHLAPVPGSSLVVKLNRTRPKLAVTISAEAMACLDRMMERYRNTRSRLVDQCIMNEAARHNRPSAELALRRVLELLPDMPYPSPPDYRVSTANLREVRDILKRLGNL